jgi:hypothetical protein
MTDPADLPAAALLDDGSVDTDALMAALARAWQDEGVRVRGLTMVWERGDDSCASPMELVDVHTADRYLVSQPLGTGALGCRADPQGFARAGGVLRRALGEAPDLVVCNRFGGLEAEGEGLRAELLALMSAGVPLLTIVSGRYRAAWDEFTGGAPVLPATAEAARAWWVAVRPTPGTTDSAAPVVAADA